MRSPHTRRVAQPFRDTVPPSGCGSPPPRRGEGPCRPLRHTFAVRLQERTGDLRIVQAALGHRQLGTTEAYARASGADVRRAVAENY